MNRKNRYSIIRDEREQEDERKRRRIGLGLLLCILLSAAVVAGTFGMIAWFRDRSLVDKTMQLMDTDAQLRTDLENEESERIASDTQLSQAILTESTTRSNKDMQLMSKDMMLDAKDMNLMDMDSMLQTEIDAIVQIGDILNATQVNITEKLGTIMMSAMALGQQLNIVFWKACNNTLSIAQNEGDIMILNSTCIKSINGQVPANGDLTLIAGFGVTIGPGVLPNELRISNTGVLRLLVDGTIPITPSGTGIININSGTGISVTGTPFSNTFTISAVAPPPTPTPAPTPAPPAGITSVMAGPSIFPGIRVTNGGGPIVSLEAELEVSQFNAYWCSAYGDDYFLDWEFTSNVLVTVIRQNRYVTVQFQTSAGDDPGSPFPPITGLFGPSTGQPIVLCLGNAPPAQEIIGNGPIGPGDNCNNVKGTFCTCFDPIRAAPCIPVGVPNLPAFQHVADRTPWDYFADVTAASADQVTLRVVGGQVRIERTFPVGLTFLPMAIGGGAFSYVTFG